MDQYSYYLNVRRALSVVSWVGQLRAADMGSIKQCTIEMMTGRPKFVILNFHDFKGYDPIMVSEIRNFHQSVASLQAWLIVCGLSTALHDKMKVDGLIKEAHLVPNLKDALQFVIDIGIK
jgi:hypothetical protein